MMDHHRGRISKDVGTLYIDNIHGSDKETESDERMGPIEHRLRSKCDALKEKSMELSLNKVLSEIEQKYERFHRTIVDDDHTSEDEECDICWTDPSCDHICNDIKRDLIE
jgi:radical SAM protein with 4Fe4S-binding SPASM domain